MTFSKQFNLHYFFFLKTLHFAERIVTCFDDHSQVGDIHPHSVMEPVVALILIDWSKQAVFKNQILVKQDSVC